MIALKLNFICLSVLAAILNSSDCVYFSVESCGNIFKEFD